MSLRLWMVTLCPLALIPTAALTAGHAEAADYAARQHVVTVAVGWSGSPCIDLVEPVNGYLTTTYSCDPAGGIATSYVAQEGAWVGVDPVESRGVALTCIVKVDGVEVIFQSGFSNIDCLGRL